MPRKPPIRIEATGTPGIHRHVYSSTKSVYIVRITTRLPDGTRTQWSGHAATYREARALRTRHSSSIRKITELMGTLHHRNPKDPYGFRALLKRIRE